VTTGAWGLRPRRVRRGSAADGRLVPEAVDGLAPLGGNRRGVAGRAGGAQVAVTVASTSWVRWSVLTQTTAQPRPPAVGEAETCAYSPWIVPPPPRTRVREGELDATRIPRYQAGGSRPSDEAVHVRIVQRDSSPRPLWPYADLRSS
jgi:hypothetical protein